MIFFTTKSKLEIFCIFFHLLIPTSSLILSDYWLFCFISMQVIDLGGEPITSGQYTHLGRVTEFKYGAKLGTVFRKWNGEKLSFTRYTESFFFIMLRRQWDFLFVIVWQQQYSI